MNSPIKTEIPARERLIFALDVPDIDRARMLISQLGDSVIFYKLGLEFFLSGNYFELAAELRDQGKKIFADLKLFDIPATVASAVRQLARHQVDFCTVHGNDSMLKAAADAKGNSKILAVTALTSLDQGDLDDLGFKCDAATLVLSRARRALELGQAATLDDGTEVVEIVGGLDLTDKVIDAGRAAVEAASGGSDAVPVRVRTEGLARATKSGGER